MYRPNKKTSYSSEELMQDAFNLAADPFFTNNFKDVYNNIEQNFYGPPMPDSLASFPLPSILNFDLPNQGPPPKIYPQQRPDNQSMQNKNDSTKYGIKTLLTTKSKMAYPFDTKEPPQTRPTATYTENKNINRPTITTDQTKSMAPITSQSMSKPAFSYYSDAIPIATPIATPTSTFVPQKNNPPTNVSIKIPIQTTKTETKKPVDPINIDCETSSKVAKEIEELIKKESLHQKENFVETVPKPIENLLEVKNLDTEKNIEYKIFINNPLSVLKPQAQLNMPISIQTDKNVPIDKKVVEEHRSSRSGIKENLSDLKSIMMPKEKKIDNKKDDNNIVKTISKMDTKTTIENTPQPTPTTTENVVDAATHDKDEKSEQKKVDAKHEPKKMEWPELTVDMINTSLKVVADLREGTKLKIVDKTHLAEDNSYIPSVSRYFANQERDHIISFLDHFYIETKRNVDIVLNNIRNKMDIDSNVYVLQGIVGKIFGFLHKYETMRNVYKSDSSAFARLGVNKEKFYSYIHTLFRDMTVPK